MGVNKIHNIRFYTPEPKAVYCMALESCNKKLAISRSDASIEIWNIFHTAHIERTLASTTDNFSIEGLAWYGNRLFSVGLHGLLLEYDLHKLCVKNLMTITGEAAFCLDTDSKRQQIAVGTEQGYLNIFDITNEGLLFNKFLDKQEGRILCLKFASDSEHIVSGGIDAIRIWNIENGHAIHRLTTGRSEANKPTIVWCLAVTNDFTIISGDSRGKLSFWDGKIGSQIESYQSHRADVLSLCLSKDQKSLYCAGIDPTITNYVKINVKDGNEKWVKSVQRKIHEHDVRALVLHENKLFSSGADGYVACSCPPKHLSKYPPILQNPCVTTCEQENLVMLRFAQFVEIWRLGETEDVDIQSGLIPLKKGPKKLLALQRIVKGQDGEEKKEGIVFSTISMDGKWIAYGTKLGIRVFQFAYEDDSEAPNLLKVENIDEKREMHHLGVFTPDSKHFVAAKSGGGLYVFNVSNDSFAISQRLEAAEITDTITFLIISKNGKYLIAADPNSNIGIWILKQKRWHFYVKLPVYTSPPNAINIHPTTSNLVVVYSDNKLVEYDVKNRRFTDFSRSLDRNLPKQWSLRTYPIRNIIFDSKAEHIIILHDDNSMIVIDKSKEMSDIEKKIPRIDSTQVDSIENIVKRHAFHSIKKYKHLVHLGWIHNDEMVAVEVSPLSLFEQLPPVLMRNKFGTK